MSDLVLVSLAARWADAIARASLEGAILAVAVWGLARLRPAWPASWRCTLWWLVCARFVLGLLWPAPLVIPILPERWSPAIGALTAAERWFASSPAIGPRTAAPAGTAASAAGEFVALVAPPDPAVVATLRPGPPVVDGGSPGGAVIRGWPVALVAIWAGFVAAGFSRAAVAWRRERALLRRASPAPPFVAAEASDIAGRLGLSREPAVLVSASAAGPCVVAGWPGAVILPPSLVSPSVSARERRLALCHELAHLQRRDLAWGLLPALTERLYFFHPAARLAAREYALAREAACDATVLALLAPHPATYARLLLRFAARTPHSALAMTGGSRSLTLLKRRLLMLDQSSGPREHSFSRWSVVPIGLVGVLAVLPWQLGVKRVEAEAMPDAAAILWLTGAQTDPQTAPPAPPPPPVPPAPPAPAPPAPSRGATSSLAPSAPASQVPPVPPVPAVPAVPAPPPPPPASGTTMQLGHGALEAVADAWVYIDGDATTMDGSRGEAARARSLRRGGAPLFWFRRGGDEYVIRSVAVLREIDAMFAPQRELGRRQGELGGRQAALGAEQGDLGGQQGQLGARQAALAARQAELVARELAAVAQRLRSGSTAGAPDSSAEVEAERKRLDREMEKLGAEMEALGRQQEALARQQETLGRQQGALGRQQEELGHQQEGLAERIASQLSALLDASIKGGAAERVR